MPLGNHITKDGNPMHIALDKLFSLAEENKIKLTCAQIFLIGPQRANENLSDAEKEGMKNIILRGVSLYAHASYLSNPWGAKSAFGISLAGKELKLCNDLGFRGLVVHLARKPPAVIAETIPALLANSVGGAILFLEIESYKPLEKDLAAVAAGKPCSATIECTYETPHKLMELATAIAAKGVDMNRIGICIDTAHLWAAGMDIASYANMKNWLAALPAGIIKNYIVHLNDQIWTLGGGKDEHAPLLRGTIWGKYNPDGGTDSPENSGLQAIVEWSRENNIDMIMERKSAKPVIKNSHGDVINNIINDYEVMSSL